MPSAPGVSGIPGWRVFFVERHSLFLERLVQSGILIIGGGGNQGFVDGCGHGGRGTLRCSGFRKILIRD